MRRKRRRALACSVQGDELDATRAEEALADAQLPLRTASMLAKTTQPASAMGLPRTTPAEKTRPTSERVVRDREVRGAYHPGGRGANGVKETRAEGDGSGYVRREGLSTRLPDPASRGAGARRGTPVVHDGVVQRGCQCELRTRKIIPGDVGSSNGLPSQSPAPPPPRFRTKEIQIDGCTRRISQLAWFIGNNDHHRGGEPCSDRARWHSSMRKSRQRNV